MRCIHCETDNDYETRTANKGHCSRCGRKFAFEPKQDRYNLSDPGFQRVIDNVSAEGRLFFTGRQVWYEFNRWIWRQRRSNPLAAAIVMALGVWIGVSVSFQVFIFSIPIAMAAGLGVYFLVWISNQILSRLAVNPDLFQTAYFQRWVDAHGPPEKLLRRPQQAAGAGLSPDKEPDLTAYSFDRVLVTQSDDIAAMLVANDFHLENKCAILSATGYPAGLFEPLLEMLRRNPRLRVFALHDASVRGFALPAALRRPEWFPEPTVVVIDLGLRPQSVKKLDLIVMPGQPAVLPPEHRGQLTDKEVNWLEQGHIAELAGLRPLQIMRAANRGLFMATQMLAAGDRAGIEGDASDLARAGDSAAATAGAMFLLTDPFEADPAQKKAVSESYMYAEFG